MVTHRTANPFTPVRFRLGPPPTWPVNHVGFDLSPEWRTSATIRLIRQGVSVSAETVNCRKTPSFWQILYRQFCINVFEKTLISAIFGRRGGWCTGRNKGGFFRVYKKGHFSRKKGPGLPSGQGPSSVRRRECCRSPLRPAERYPDQPQDCRERPLRAVGRGVWEIQPARAQIALNGRFLGRIRYGLGLASDLGHKLASKVSTKSGCPAFARQPSALRCTPCLQRHHQLAPSGPQPPSTSTSGDDGSIGACYA